MEVTSWDIQSAWGYALIEQNRAREALVVLNASCTFFQQSGRLSRLTHAALDLYKAVMLAGDQDGLDRAESLFDEHEVGYVPHIWLLRADAELRYGEPSRAVAHVAKAREAAAPQGNRWAAMEADRLDQQIAARQTNP